MILLHSITYHAPSATTTKLPLKKLFDNYCLANNLQEIFSVSFYFIFIMETLSHISKFQSIV